MPKSKRGVLIANVSNLGHSEVVRPVRFLEAVIVFHAFLKTTQSTPVREIRLARKRLQEVLDEKA